MFARESWVVLDLDTRADFLLSNHDAFAIEFQEPAQAVSWFHRLCERDFVAQCRQHRNADEAEPPLEPQDAIVTPNPHVDAAGCTWEYIGGCSQISPWNLDATPILKIVPARWVVCVATRLPGGGARVWPEGVDRDRRLVNAVLLRIPDPNSPEAVALRVSGSIIFNRNHLLEEPCLDCKTQFFVGNGRQGRYGLVLRTFCPVRYSIVLEKDLRDADFGGSRDGWEEAKRNYWYDAGGRRRYSPRPIWGLRVEGPAGPVGLLIGKQPFPKEWKRKLAHYLCWECRRKRSDELELVWSLDGRER